MRGHVGAGVGAAYQGRDGRVMQEMEETLRMKWVLEAYRELSDIGGGDREIYRSYGKHQESWQYMH